MEYTRDTAAPDPGGAASLCWRRALEPLDPAFGSLIDEASGYLYHEMRSQHPRASWLIAAPDATARSTSVVTLELSAGRLGGRYTPTTAHTISLTCSPMPVLPVAAFTPRLRSAVDAAIASQVDDDRIVDCMVDELARAAIVAGFEDEDELLASPGGFLVTATATARLALVTVELASEDADDGDARRLYVDPGAITVRPDLVDAASPEAVSTRYRHAADWTSNELTSAEQVQPFVAAASTYAPPIWWSRSEGDDAWLVRCDEHGPHGPIVGIVSVVAAERFARLELAADPRGATAYRRIRAVTAAIILAFGIGFTLLVLHDTYF